MAHTAEGAHSVHTLAVSTQSPLRRTLIDIWWTHRKHDTSHKGFNALGLLFYEVTSTDARTYAVTVVWVLEAGVAETVVGADCVLTGPVATGLSLTFIHVWNQRAASKFHLRHYSLSGVQHCKRQAIRINASYRHTSTGPALFWIHWGRCSGSSPECQCTDQDCTYRGSQCIHYGLKKEENNCHTLWNSESNHCKAVKYTVSLIQLEL